MLTGGARTTVPELRADALAPTVFPVDADGVILGRDSTGRPVTLRLFDAVPRRVVFIGGWWAAQILVSRCLAVGAMVAVDAHPAADSADAVAIGAQWLALGRFASGANGRIRPIPPNIDEWPATAAQPVLRLRDVGPAGPASNPRRPWHTELTVLSTVGPATGRAIADADVVLVQRLAHADADLVRLALELGPEYTPLLGAMENEMVAAFGGGVVRYTWLTPTPVERQLFG
jgi:hypothetical protein